MGDPPFDLAKFDPSSLDLSHLDWREQNRIRVRDFDTRELGLLLSGQNPWTKSGKPKPLPPQSREPTADDQSRKQLDALHSLIGQAQKAEPPKPQLGAIIDSLKKSASAEPQPKADAPTPAEDKSLHGTIQDEVDKFATHVGRQLEEEINQSLRRPRFVGSGPAATSKELADAELRKFMPEQVRAEYEKADTDQRKVIWEANKRAFEAAKKRKDEKLRHEQELMTKVYDALQRVKEDPSKHHLLPPADASTSELQTWYEDMQKPVRTIPFPTPSKRWLRQDRINRAIQSGERPDPEDLAEEAAENAHYQRNLEKAFEKKFDEFEWTPPTSKKLIEREAALARESAKTVDEPPVSPKPPAPRPSGDEKLLRGLETKEIVALVVTFLALVLVFFVGAPTAAGVIDMTLARILLFSGWAGAVIAAFVIELLSSRSRKRIAVTTLLIALVVGLFALYSNHWIGKKKAEQEHAMLPPQPSPMPSPSANKTLHDYFAEGNTFAIETLPEQLHIKNESVNVEARINMNYVARARFLTFYVPDTPHTFEACSLILARTRATIAEFDREFHDEYGPVEGRKTGMKDLKFTGQIIIYHQRLLLQSEIDSLTAKATKAGLSVEFRGTYYVMARMK